MIWINSPDACSYHQDDFMGDIALWNFRFGGVVLASGPKERRRRRVEPIRRR